MVNVQNNTVKFEVSATVRYRLSLAFIRYTDIIETGAKGN
jgi:hypothetical protein